MAESNAESLNGVAEKPWQFKKGQSGNPGGKPKSGNKPAQVLRDMRRVYRQDESKDRTPGEKLCRRWLHDNPKDFLSQLARLEASAGASKQAEAKHESEPEEPDERQEKVEALIDKLLEGL